MNNLDDTQPTKIKYQAPPPSPYVEPAGTKAPPKILLFAVIGFCLLVVVGIAGSIVAFREVLTPAQRVRVIDQVPFMARFLPPTPMGGALPTVAPDVASDDDAMNLLSMPLALRTPTPDASSVIVPDVPTDAPDNGDPFVDEVTPIASPTLTPTLTPTLLPTLTPTFAPTNTPAERASVSGEAASPAISLLDRIPSANRINGLRWNRQTWNNCGPATLTMALSYYGWQEDQSYIGDILKPNREDKNVSPDELVDFVNTQTGVRALSRMGGDMQTLKRLLANNYPVIVERGILYEGYDWQGHYQALVGYDDAQGIFYAFDSFLQTNDNLVGITQTYDELDQDWRAFNRLFIVIYPQEDESRVMSLLGDLWSDASAAELALAKAQTEARANPQDGFAWFNMGTSLVELGEYQQAANAFDQARRYDLPWRMLWYQFGPFEAYFQMGRYDEVLSLVQINLNNAEELEESYYWRGRVYEARGETQRAASEYRTALRYNPNFAAARQALDAL